MNTEVTERAKKQIYKEWEKITLALNPVFNKMSPDMLRFFRDKADYTPPLQDLAGLTLKAKLKNSNVIRLSRVVAAENRKSRV